MLANVSIPCVLAVMDELPSKNERTFLVSILIILLSEAFICWAKIVSKILRKFKCLEKFKKKSSQIVNEED